MIAELPGYEYNTREYIKSLSEDLEHPIVKGFNFPSEVINIGSTVISITKFEDQTTYSAIDAITGEEISVGEMNPVVVGDSERAIYRIDLEERGNVVICTFPQTIDSQFAVAFPLDIPHKEGLETGSIASTYNEQAKDILAILASAELGVRLLDHCASYENSGDLEIYETLIATGTRTAHERANILTQIVLDSKLDTNNKIEHVLFGERLVHDLLRPLGNLQLGTNVIDAKIPENQFEDGVKILRPLLQMESLHEFTKDLLDVRDIPPFHPEYANLEYIIQNVMKGFEILAEKSGISIKHTVLSEMAKDKDLLMVDTLQIFSLLSNQVANALRYAGKGGEIRILADRTSKGDMRLVVSNTGKGISPDTLTKMFKLWGQGDEDNKGFGGVGMNLCKQIADAHGGRIYVETKYEDKRYRGYTDGSFIQIKTGELLPYQSEYPTNIFTEFPIRGY